MLQNIAFFYIITRISPCEFLSDNFNILRSIKFYHSPKQTSENIYK